MGRHYRFDGRRLKLESERIDLDQVESLAKEFQPKLIVAGASAYPRFIDFEGFAQIAKSVDAHFMVDMAHIAGLVAAEVHPSPVPHADIVTTTVHKTLRGPRAGLILCKKKLAKKINSSVFPGNQGGPLMHLVAARAVCFHEAASTGFRAYARQVVANAKVLGEVMADAGLRLVSGGTDNHLVLVDLRPLGLTGDVGENALARAGIVVNMNMIPYDPNPPRTPSGLRLGTPCITSRGMKEDDIRTVGEWIAAILKDPENASLARNIGDRVRDLCEQKPIFP